MRLQPRDIQVLSEIALHGVMARNQLVELGLFGSVSRANARLCPLAKLGFLKRISVIGRPQSGQSLYIATTTAAPYLDERIRLLVACRKNSPRFIEHSLMVVEIRVILHNLGGGPWRHECMVRHRYTYKGISYEFRPDGLMLIGGNSLFVEADRGNASGKSLKESFASYDRYATSGVFAKTYGQSGFRVLVVTVGKRRAASIRAIVKGFRVAISVITIEELNVATSLKEVLR